MSHSLGDVVMGESISVNTFSVQKHKCWLARERSIRKLIKVVQYVWVLRSTQVSPLASTPPQNADRVVKTDFESLVSQASWFPCQQCTWSLSAWQASCSQLFYEVLKHMADTLDFIEEKLLYQKRTALMRHPVMGSWTPDSLYSSRWCLPYVGVSLATGLSFAAGSNELKTFLLPLPPKLPPLLLISLLFSFVSHHEILFQSWTNNKTILNSRCVV